MQYCNIAIRQVVITSLVTRCFINNCHLVKGCYISCFTYFFLLYMYMYLLFCLIFFFIWVMTHINSSVKWTPFIHHKSLLFNKILLNLSKIVIMFMNFFKNISIKMMQLIAMEIFVCVIILIALLCCACLSSVKGQKVIVSFSTCVYMCVTVRRNIICFCFIIDSSWIFIWKILKTQEIISFSVSNYMYKL